MRTKGKAALKPIAAFIRRKLRTLPLNFYMQQFTNKILRSRLKIAPGDFSYQLALLVTNISGNKALKATKDGLVIVFFSFVAKIHF